MNADRLSSRHPRALQDGTRMADRLGMVCSLKGLCGACSVTAPGGYVEGSSVEDLTNLLILASTRGVLDGT